MVPGRIRNYWIVGFISQCLLFAHQSFATGAINRNNITIAAYYYPWYGDNFHNHQGYLRKALNQTPRLGEYNDQDPAIIRQHLQWSRQATIGVWVTSWFGPHKREDLTTKTVLLPTLLKTDHKLCLLYETNNRLKDRKDPTGRTTERVLEDIQYIAATYFEHPNYYKVNGRPVLFVYLTRTLQRYGVQEETLLLLRSGAARMGYALFLVGDEAFGDAPTNNDKDGKTNTDEDEQVYRAFHYLDAVTNYDIYGKMTPNNNNNKQPPQQIVNGVATPAATPMELLTAVTAADVRRFYETQAAWKSAARAAGCFFLPSVSPGYNDLGVRWEKRHPPLSRALRGGTEGSFFAESIKWALRQVDPQAHNLLVVNSFNEFHEDTQIEPVDGPTTKEPHNLTLGVEYEGYGELYLDILRQVVRGDDDGTEGIASETPAQLPPNEGEEEKEEPAESLPNREEEKGEEASIISPQEEEEETLLPPPPETLDSGIFVNPQHTLLNSIFQERQQRVEDRDRVSRVSSSDDDRDRRDRPSRQRVRRSGSDNHWH